MDPVALFYHIDEFCKVYDEKMEEKTLSGDGIKRRKRLMTRSEILTLRIMYHESGYKTLKDFFKRENAVLRDYFRGLASYSRFIELCIEELLPFMVLAKIFCTISRGDVHFIDSTKLEVCHVRRASGHKTFEGCAAKGHTSVSWFFGFKLHLVNDMDGNIANFDITTGNVADNNQSLIRRITKKLTGKLLGDRGYLLNKELYAELAERGLTVITKSRTNMKPRLMSFDDKTLLQKRGISESIIGILKCSLGLEHSRHRSPLAFIVHVASTIIAYFFRPNKPSIAFTAAPSML
jgi:hypothetical protein